MSLEFNKEWISVVDKKPENNDLVYVFNIKQGGWRGYLASYYGGEKDYFSLDGGSFPVEVTHWYPLPYPSWKQK